MLHSYRTLQCYCHIDHRSKERKKTVDIDILVTSRNGNSKIMQLLTILKGNFTRSRSEASSASSDVMPI